MFEQFKEKKEALKGVRSKQVISKYGGEEHFEAPPKELLLAQSESYVEYSESGEVIKGQEAAIPMTKYVEDAREGNHTSVWGSYYHKGKWGYACCHGTMRNAYCTGSAGKEATGEKRQTPQVPVFGKDDGAMLSLAEIEAARAKQGKPKRKNDDADDGRASKKNKQGYNSGSVDQIAGTPDDKDMEKYYRSRSDAFNDPLKDMKDVTGDL